MKISNHYSNKPTTPNSTFQIELAENLWASLEKLGARRRQVKMHILTMFFYKFLSDNSNYFDESAGRKGGKWNISKEISFDTLVLSQHKANLGTDIHLLLDQVEQRNPILDGLLKQYDFNDSRIFGDLQERDEILRTLIRLLASVDLSDTSVAIQYFEFLIDKMAIEGGKIGDDFQTPASLCRLMALLLQPRHGDSVYDPACGSGGLLLSLVEEVNPNNPKTEIFGQESSLDIYNLARMNMMVHGIKDAHLALGDSLNFPRFKEENHTKLQQFDIVVSNPPISMQNWRNPGIEENDRFDRFPWGVPPDSKSDFAFISHMIASASEKNGRIGVITNHGALFRGGAEQKIRQGLVENNLLSAVIGLPGNLLEYTGIPVVVLLFEKGRKDDSGVLFIDCSQEFYTLGRRYSIKPEGIERTISTYLNFQKKEWKNATMSGFSQIATRNDIRNNNYNLSISRYIDPVITAHAIDVEKLEKEIIDLDKRIREIDEQMRNGLKDLGLQ